MRLSKSTCTDSTFQDVEKPSLASFELPEKVIQFGTGVLLRGLPDYFFDKANKRDVFGGRVLVVKSTTSSGTKAFDEQDNLYTLCVKGLEEGKEVERYIINNVISRVLSAHDEWKAILQAAQNPMLQILVSNTTEVGIVLSDDKMTDSPPASFPGKVLSFLYARYQYFQGAADKGLVVLPTELISYNGEKLKKIIFSLARQNDLEPAFFTWLESANDFCNTLVDRIVPGALPDADHQKAEAMLGYKDELLIMAEPFRLWAIETDSERVKAALSFAEVDPGIRLVPSIEKYKEIKLRLLNGTHTLVCAAALLNGVETVKGAMANPVFREFVENLMYSEIGPAIVDSHITQSEVDDFAKQVIDRFSNPFIDHKWTSIAFNYTSKMFMRNIGLLKKWYSTHENHVPLHIAFGFAAYIVFMRSHKEDDQYVSMIEGCRIVLQDEFAPRLYEHWQDEHNAVHAVLSDTVIWSDDLMSYPGFADAVAQYVDDIFEQGVMTTMEKLKTVWQTAY